MSDYRPEGWRTVTPRIFVEDVSGLVDFMRKVFDAKGDTHASRPSEMHIGDSIVMISGAEFRGPMPACLYVYVPDTDAAYARAVHAGAATIEEPLDTPYGDRRCVVKDKWNNLWQIATRK